MIVPTLVHYMYSDTTGNNGIFHRKSQFQKQVSIQMSLLVARTSGNFFLAQSFAAAGISVVYQPLLAKQATPMLRELDPLHPLRG